MQVPKTEAHLEVTGGTKDVRWVQPDGKKQRLAYSVPNINQRKGCHVKNQKMLPIGPTARQLNREYPYAWCRGNRTNPFCGTACRRTIRECACPSWVGSWCTRRA